MSRETVTNILSHGNPIILQGEVVKIQALTFGIHVPFGGSAGASGGPPGGGASDCAPNVSFNGHAPRRKNTSSNLFKHSCFSPLLLVWKSQENWTNKIALQKSLKCQKFFWVFGLLHLTRII